MEALDLQGVSGAVYRFRAVANADDLPRHAGNFVVAQAGDAGALILACGTRRSLSELHKLWNDLTADGARVYVRLNVGRGVRLSEQDDLVAALHPTEVLPEPR